MDAGGEQVSVAGWCERTVAPHMPGAAGTEIDAGHTTDGGVLSTTVTLPVAWLVAPRGSTTVSSTHVVPIA